jgi:hypothetical protein
MTAGLLAFLTVLVILGKFLDFLFGEKGDQQVRRHLEAVAGELPVTAGAQGNYPRWAAASVEAFLDKYFGGLFSRRALLHCLYFSGTVTCLITLLVILTDDALPGFFDQPAEDETQGLTIAFVLVLGANFIVDYCSLTTTRVLLNRTLRAPRHWVWYLVGLQLFLSYLFVVMAMNLTFSGIIFAQGMVEGYFANTLGRGDYLGFLAEALAAWGILFESYTLQSYFSPVKTGEMLAIGSTNLLVFSLTAALPSMLYAIAMAAAALLENLDFLIGSFLKRLVARLTEHERPVFLNLALGTAGLITAVKALT